MILHAQDTQRFLWSPHGRRRPHRIPLGPHTFSGAGQICPAPWPKDMPLLSLRSPRVPAPSTLLTSSQRCLWAPQPAPLTLVSLTALGSPCSAPVPDPTPSVVPLGSPHNATRSCLPPSAVSWFLSSRCSSSADTRVTAADGPTDTLSPQQGGKSGLGGPQSSGLGELPWASRPGKDPVDGLCQVCLEGSSTHKTQTLLPHR